MTLLAPAAAVTDFILALTAFVLSRGCLRQFRRTRSSRTRWWTWGYAALGLGSLLDTVVLGWQTGLERPIFYVARFAIGLAVLAMLSAVVESLAAPAAARRWRGLFVVAFAAYYAATLFSSSFLIFIAYSGTALLATLILEGYRWLGRQEPGAAWMAVGMAASIGAAALQSTQLTFTLGWSFDHNAIYHLVQFAALLLLYRGVTAGAASAPGTLSRSA